MKRVFLDFEFNDEAVIVGCFLEASGERTSIDCRTVEGRTELHRFVDARRDALWCSYSVIAEMMALQRLGVDLRGMRWLDLMTEAAMICGTFDPLYVARSSLLRHLEAFGIAHGSADTKSDMIDLILSKADFTAEEMAAIEAYCWTDVEPLPDLLQRIEAFHVMAGSPWEIDHAIQRADYSKAMAVLEARSHGLPVDEAWIDRIFANRRKVRNALAKKANAEYGHPIYRWNAASDDFSFSYAGLEAYLASQPWGLVWERTQSGRLRTDADYVDDLIRQFPTAKLLGWVKDGLAQLKTDGLRDLIHHDAEGRAYVRPTSIPFWTVTSRNQPMVKRGFILNMPPWLRTTVRPHPGRVLVAADWGKQEIAIGCALSGDRALLEAYLTGDIYLTLAKMAGAVPSGGTKDSHPVQRQTYKSVQLGLGYGMGRDALARQIYNDINSGSAEVIHDIDWCRDQANRIYAWHKRTFKAYWSFLEREAREAKRRGWNTSLDGWLYFANDNTKTTRLINFPSQSNGAAMLREAIHSLAFQTDVNVVCSLHDAIYAECAEEDVEVVKTKLKDHMDRAAKRVVGDIPIDVDFKVFDHVTGYQDGRGKAMLEMIRETIEEVERVAA